MVEIITSKGLENTGELGLTEKERDFYSRHLSPEEYEELEGLTLKFHEAEIQAKGIFAGKIKGFITEEELRRREELLKKPRVEAAAKKRARIK